MSVLFVLLLVTCSVSAFSQFNDHNKRKHSEEYKKKHNYRSGDPGFMKISPEVSEAPEPEKMASIATET
jgi:hypothetical protein